MIIHYLRLPHRLFAGHVAVWCADQMRPAPKGHRVSSEPSSVTCEACLDVMRRERERLCAWELSPSMLRAAAWLVWGEAAKAQEVVDTPAKLLIGRFNGTWPTDEGSAYEWQRNSETREEELDRVADLLAGLTR